MGKTVFSVLTFENLTKQFSFWWLYDFNVILDGAAKQSFESSFFSENKSIFLTENRGQFHQRVYVQLLHAQIPKAQKDSQVKQLFALSGSLRIKAVPKHVDEIDPR